MNVYSYQIIEEIGRGTTGIVYLARHEKLKRQVALKMPDLSSAIDRHAKSEQFLNECRATANLSYRPENNLPALYEVSEWNGQPFCVREWIEGSTLEARAASGTLGMRVGLGVLAGVAASVHWVHSCGFVHGNLSPANVLVATDNTPKLIGFGRVQLIVGSEYLQPGFTGSSPMIDVRDLQELLEWLSVSVGESIPAKLQMIRKTCPVSSPEHFENSIRGYLDRSS